MLNIKGAIFDVDGTLLDSMPIWDKVSYDYLISRGVTPREDIYESMRSVGGHQVPQYFQKEYGITESADEIRKAVNDMLAVYYNEKVPLKDGALELLKSFSERGIKMCVVTATDSQLIIPALSRCGVLDYFKRVFSCGEERLNKSEPDIFFRAAELLGTKPGETIVFEDALYAIKTASVAGFPVAAVYDKSEHVYQDEIRSIADYYFTSLSEYNTNLQ